MSSGDLAHESDQGASDDSAMPQKRKHVMLESLSPRSAPARSRRLVDDVESELDELPLGALARGFAHLRTPYAPEKASGGPTLCVVLGCMILVFLVIWWAAGRLLLLEVGDLVGPPSRRSFAA
jgi:hypothetical protein